MSPYRQQENKQTTLMLPGIHNLILFRNKISTDVINEDTIALD